MEAASRSRSSAPSQPGSSRGGLGRGRRGGSAVLRDGERGLRRQEQQGEQRASKAQCETP